MTRLKREHGRIMSVETKTRGDALAEDAAAGATTITVGDAGDFDEDGGWLTVNDEVIEYLDVDDDEGTITLATGLAAAAEEGDHVHVWSTLYDEVVDYQEALVELDGEYDNPEPVVAEVAEGVADLPEGDRGVDGESCTLLRVSDDEWEVVGVGGRGRKSKSIRFEADDAYTLTQADIDFGSAAFDLSHRPIDESLTGYWGGVFQPPTEYSVDYDNRTISWTLGGFEQPGDELWVHYAYRKGLPKKSGWKYLLVAESDSTNRSAETFDDSGWKVGPAPFGTIPLPTSVAKSNGWPEPKTTWPLDTAIWLRKTFSGYTTGASVDVTVRLDQGAVDIYWNGTLIGSPATPVESATVSVPTGLVTDGENVVAVRGSDLGIINYIDVEVI